MKARAKPNDFREVVISLVTKGRGLKDVGLHFKAAPLKIQDWCEDEFGTRLIGGVRMAIGLTEKNTLCPRCGIRERRVWDSGNVSGYCKECVTGYKKEYRAAEPSEELEVKVSADELMKLVEEDMRDHYAAPIRVMTVKELEDYNRSKR